MSNLTNMKLAVHAQKMLDMLLYVEHELRDYATGPAYDDQAESAFIFMDDLADEIRTCIASIEGTSITEAQS